MIWQGFEKIQRSIATGAVIEVHADEPAAISIAGLILKRWKPIAHTMNGGIVQATPAGVVEITEAGARFVRFFDPQMAMALIGGGIIMGLLLRRLFSRK